MTRGYQGSDVGFSKGTQAFGYAISQFVVAVYADDKMTGAQQRRHIDESGMTEANNDNSHIFGLRPFPAPICPAWQASLKSLAFERCRPATLLDGDRR
jgi:hypothetical protein